MPHHRRDPSANALAQGAKTENVEATRRAVDRAQHLAATELRASDARSHPDVARHNARHKRLGRQLTGDGLAATVG